MCGIAAHFNLRGPAEALDLDALAHRGPDGAGTWRSPDQRIWLGHRRLAILDLSPAGAQPMRDGASGNVIIFNGEIYNHHELRARLAGHVWQSSSDTETLLVAYARWQEEMLPQLKGMFAFVIFDAGTGGLFVGRDRFGMKPLYLAAHEGWLIASEVRLIMAKLRLAPTPPSLSVYLQYGTSPEELLLFPAIKVLPAGHWLRISAGGESETGSYWPRKNSFRGTTGRDAPGTVRQLLETAVEEHLLADVPVASFLSGGIDSSIITALAARKLGRTLQTFSIGFSQRHLDETQIAEMVSRRYHTHHCRIELSEEEILSSIPEAVSRMDLPSVDALNTYIVARKVAAQGIKAALSGLGGDELFGGYPIFREWRKLLWLARLPPAVRRLLGSLSGNAKRFEDLTSANVPEIAWWRRRFWTSSMLATAGLPVTPIASGPSPDLPDPGAQLAWAELTGYMRHMLLRDSDQMTMAVSLELRVPFLDHPLVEFVLGLSSRQRQFGTGKRLLLEACSDLLPPEVYHRPKMGFVLPMADWMRGPLETYVNTGLQLLRERRLIPGPPALEAVRQDFRAGRLHWTRLWSLVVLGHYLARVH